MMRRLFVSICLLLAIVACGSLADAARISGAGGGSSLPTATPEGNCLMVSGGAWASGTCPGAGSGAPATVPYWTGAADATLSAEANLGALGTGLVINTAGVPSIYAGATCTNQVVRVLGANGAATCATITSAFVDATIWTGTVATGMLKASSQGVVAQAVAGTDYVVPAGNVATATSLAANGANCPAGQFPLGVTAAGAAETCTALPTTIAGTASEITASAATGAVTLSLPSPVSLATKGLILPSSITLPGTCSVGQVYMDTDATSGSRLYLCETTNTWVVQGGGGGITASSTDTFTNKTLDVEGTGNTVTILRNLWFPAAGCNNATAGSVWDLPTTNAAVPACVTGTNTQKGVLDYADGSNLSAQWTHMLPAQWTGTVDAKIKWFSSTTTGNVVWQLAASCVADGETDDPTFNASTPATDVTKGTANQTNDATITSLNVTGCAAGELIHFKIFRDSAHASDTMAGTARLIGIQLTLREAQ